MPVSPDAIIDETRGLVYPARIRITGSTLRAERLGLGATSTQNSVQGSNTNKREGAGSPERDLCDALASRDQLEGCPDRELVSGEDQARVNNLKTTLELTQIGMAVTAEVKTGTRSVLSYLLSPIAKAASEAGRER